MTVAPAGQYQLGGGTLEHGVSPSLAALASSPAIAYATIPLVCAFVGWFTNWVALKMTFYPVRFVGWPPFLGWQGVIPRKSAKIAGRAVDLMTSHLVARRDLFRGIDGEGLVADLLATLEAPLTRAASAVLASQGGIGWDQLPESVREDVLGALRTELGEALRELGEEIVRRDEDLLELKSLIVETLTGDGAQLLNEIFLRCGSKEFRFIERSGLYLGGALGVLQAIVWTFYPRWWSLPIVGLVVGYVTNWVALKMIFRPLRPKRYLFVTYQGMFLRRQDEISNEYASLIASEVLTPPRIVARLTHGPTRDALCRKIEEHVVRAFDRATDVTNGTFGVLLATMTPKAHADAKALTCRAIVDHIPACALVAERHLRGAMDLHNLIYPRLRALPQPEFENILHACFQEDEFLLIAIGGAFGLAIGLAQGLYFQHFGV